MLPSRFPNLLVNGSQGIAVGMATNIPPHNLGEVIDADGPPDRPSRGDVRRPDGSSCKGPDFPTGAQIMGRQGIIDAFRTGRGSIKLRAVAEIEEGGRNDRIVVTEMPYQTSISNTAPEDQGARRDAPDRRHRRRERRVRQRQDPTRDQAQARRARRWSSSTTSTSTRRCRRTSRSTWWRSSTACRARSTCAMPRCTTSTTRSRSSPAGPSSGSTKARDRAHIVEGLLKALDMIDADHRRDPRISRQGGRPRGADGRRRSSSPRCRPSTSSTCSSAA